MVDVLLLQYTLLEQIVALKINSLSFFCKAIGGLVFNRKSNRYAVCMYRQGIYSYVRSIKERGQKDMTIFNYVVSRIKTKGRKNCVTNILCAIYHKLLYIRFVLMVMMGVGLQVLYEVMYVRSGDHLTSYYSYVRGFRCDLSST